MGFVDTASTAITGVSGLASSLIGKTDRVQFIPEGGTAFQMDVSLTEDHSRQSSPTEFPLEDGSVISDHIVISPFELTITGVISDTPLGTVSTLLKEVFTSAASALAPPLGLVVPAAAYALHTAMQKLPSLSVVAYAQLLKLQAGDPTSTPPTPPRPFTVLTSLYRYPNMVIKSLSVPRSVSTGKTLQFTVTLQQLLLVSAQTVSINVFANPALASNKGNLGEQDAESLSRFDEGRFDVHKAAGR